MKKSPEKHTVLILTDQLSERNAALLCAQRGRDRLLFVESRQTLGKLPYHRHRLMLLISAMRHYAAERAAEGWDVEYHRLENAADMRSVLDVHCRDHKPSSLLVAQPNNHDEHQALKLLGAKLSIPLTIIPTSQFLCSREDFLEFADGKKRLLMENFYREMRRRTGLLMEGEKGSEPLGGQWNYDIENRATFADWKKAGMPRPKKLLRLQQDEITREVARELEVIYPDAPGKAADFALPVTRAESLKTLRDFIESRLSEFGTWQDLMVAEEGDLFHSILSPILNIGLLDPMECALAAERALKEGKAPLHAVEGFIRQVIGWREFVNGVYWLKMPEYASVNGLNATRSLPAFFYTGETSMHCLSIALRETLQSGFNHHIQRLMVLGNFLLLAGIDPQEALRWFNEMYVDAHDWVMAANLLGMALHADGGFMATKPYAASGAYISKMSNYCDSCAFSPSIKSGKGACPLNLLYWNFFNAHQDLFVRNPRTSMPVRSWQKRDPKDRLKIVSEAEAFLESLC
jgi:deoxyribodipyrimidine photolyase-related protein